MPPPRSHTSLGFTERSKEEGRFGAQSVLGHAAQPAASFGFDSRKQNLDPRKKKDLMSIPRQTKPGKAPGKDGVQTFRQRQQEREERNKNHYIVPDAVEKIQAEKLIHGNPLLDPASEQKSDYKVKNLSSLSLTDLCTLRIAFENADEDGSGELDNDEFVQAFLPVLAADAGDVSLLFMKIDANCDGSVSWEEFLSYIVSQDEGALQIARESSRQMFDYPPVADSGSQIVGHKDTAGGLILLQEADRYISYSRKGDVLVWRPDGLEGMKIHHPKEFMTDLPFITGMTHIKRRTHSDRIAFCSADKQVILVDLMRDTCKLSGKIRVDYSPISMCLVAIMDDKGNEKESMLGFGDDSGCIHLYDMAKLNIIAERNMMSSNVWDAKEAHIKTWTAHEKSAWVNKIEYYDDIRVLVSCASDGQIVLSDVSKGAVKVDGLRHRGEVHDFAWLPKVQLLASCGLERHVNLWQIPIKTPVYKLEGHQASIQQLIYGAGQLLSLDTSKTVIVWDLKEMGEIQRLEALKVHQEYPIGCILFDEKRNSMVSLARKMLFWHITERKVPNGHTAPVTCLCYNQTFELVVSADETSLVRVWDLNTGRALLRFQDAHVSESGEPVKISSVMFDQTQRRLITGAHDGSIKIWNFSTGQCLRELVGFGVGEVAAMANMHIAPYDYFLATGWNHKVTFWLDPNSVAARSIVTRQVGPSHHFEGHKDDVLSMVCNSEEGLLITGAFDGDLVLWNTDTGNPRTRLVLPGILAMKGDQKPIEALQLITCTPARAHSAAGKGAQEPVILLATAGGDGVIRFWSTNTTAELLLEMEVPESVEAGLAAVHTCERSKVMIVADNSGVVFIYDIVGTIRSAKDALYPTSEPLIAPVRCSQFKAHNMPICRLHYINARRLIVTGSQDCTLCLWTVMGERLGTFGETVDWKLNATLHRHEKSADNALFGKTFAAEMDDNKKKMKRAQTSKKLHISERLHKTNPSNSTSIQANVSQASTEGDTFFMTQTEEIESDPKDKVPEEGREEVDEEYDRSSGHSGEESDSGSEWLSEAEGDEVDEAHLARQAFRGIIDDPEALKRTMLLKVDIDEIVSRGLAMKERGEKFFEAGHREVTAWQKMIVRDPANFKLPDRIQKRMNRAHRKHKEDKKDMKESDQFATPLFPPDPGAMEVPPMPMQT